MNESSENNVKLKEELPGEGAADFLKIVAVLYLVASVIGGIYLMMQKVGASSYSTKSDPTYVAYGIGIIISGIVFFALSQVLAAICYNVLTIAKNSAKPD